MCGIAGLYYRQAACDRDRLIAMRDIMVHRGPDDGGLHIDGPLGLAHRRLSIIDLGGGHQPMSTEDERFHLVFNGEIYNHNELRQELEREGVKFKSHSDTEVILRLHAQHGDSAVGRLNGIFAYALWDKSRNRLLLARDRAGIKPLYFSQNPQGVAFASEIKALFKSDIVAPRLNEKHVAEYLIFRQVAGDENLFDGVRVLPPGHTLEVINGEARAPQAYWSSRTQPEPFTGSYRDAVDALDKALNAAVARQLMSDVPLGTFCSGGIDSSLTTAIAAKHASKKINTFSVGFHEASYDESAYARMAAEACGTQHHELKIDEQQYADLLPKLIWHHDLPLNFANSVHIYAVSELARKHVTVVLTGEGADELFGGYPRYYIPRLLQIAQRIPGFVRTPLFGLLAHAPDNRMRKLAQFGRRPMNDTLLYNCTGTDPQQVLGSFNIKPSLELAYRKACIQDAEQRGLDPVSTLAQLDFQTYLVSILNRQDKMSMATSIEARVPFLDNEIIDFARSLPIEFKQTFKHRKRVLKDVALRYLPAEIVHRRKSGFGVPLQPWFAGAGPMAALLDDALASNYTAALFNKQVLGRLQVEHRSGAADHSELLWGILNLHMWRQSYGV